MEKNICPACKNKSDENSNLCIKCHFPFGGTDKEKAVHISQFILKKGVIFDSDSSIEKSQKIIGLIAIINASYLIVGIYNSIVPLFNIVLNSVVIGIFVWCAITIKKNPFEKTLIPLILFISIILLNTLLVPSSIFQGIIWKIVVIGSLVYSLYLVKSSENFKKTFGDKR